MPARARRCLAVLLLALAMLPANLARAETETGKKRALLVGVRDYKSSKFEPLDYTENDVEELAKVLLGEARFDDVRVLTSTRGAAKTADAPTRANVQAALTALLADRGRHDTLLVALSGHGMQAKVKDGTAEKDDSFFCPSDAQLNDTSTLISLRTLFKDLDASGAGVKLLLVDACRNDPTLGRNVDIDTLPRLPRGSAALFSCKSGERAFESKKLGRGHGVFFYHVLEGLKGKAMSMKGDVTWGSLVEYVTDKVSDDVPVLIGGGAKQTPELKVNLTGKSPVLVRLSEGDRLFRLAREHRLGDGRPIDEKEAVSLYQKAAALGHPLASAALGICCLHGIGTDRDATRAQRLCREAAGRVKAAADRGSAVGQFLLGHMHLYALGVEANNKETARLYRLAAAQGLAEAHCNLGVLCTNGWGVEKDPKEAVAWYRKAADQGIAQAQFNLGVCSYSGQGVVQDYGEAARWYRKAADQGYSWAQYNLAVLYRNGQGVAKDEKEAVRWFRKAANQGDAAAQNHLGDCCYHGLGVTKSFAEALRWYRRAAEEKLPLAQSNLGKMYYYGRAVKKDYAEAVRWYRLAADQHLPEAQFHLGLLHEHGHGVARSLPEARKWYRKAADQGHANARARLAKMPRE
jgi:TPR repeat protein